MRVSWFGVAKRRARDFLSVDLAKLLVQGALDVARESPRKPFAVVAKNTT